MHNAYDYLRDLRVFFGLIYFKVTYNFKEFFFLKRLQDWTSVTNKDFLVVFNTVASEAN